MSVLHKATMLQKAWYSNIVFEIWIMTYAT